MFRNSNMIKILSVGIVVLLMTGGLGVLKGTTDSSGYPTPKYISSQFFDDMENGTNGWNATGFWHIVTNESASPAWNISYSGNSSWWYGQDGTGNYDDGSRNRGNLTSPLIDITEFPVYMNFKSYYETENSNGYPDVRSVMISVNGSTFQEVFNLSGDPMNSWNDHTYNITSYMSLSYGYELPWSENGTVLSPTLSQEGSQIIDETVIKDDAVYKIWYPGRDSSGKWRIFYATSLDGINWTKYGVVLDLENGTDNVNYPSLIKDGSIYKLWYTVNNGTAYCIRYATSSDGLNWTRHGIVLEQSETGYDSAQIYDPSVLKDGNIYKMWYTGSDGSNPRIMYATSTDGINWTKQGMVLDYGSLYENEGVRDPTVVLMPDGKYRMWYTAYNNDGSSNRYRIKSAYSYDGISWTEGDVEINFGAAYEPDGTGFPCVILDGSELKMWYTGVNWNGPEVINYASTPINTHPTESNIRIRFCFDTINNISNDYRGWYIDDLLVGKKTSPSVSETGPANGENYVAVDRTVKVVFDYGMDTTVVPALIQNSGTPVNYTFVGWESTYRTDDTAVWSHDNWVENETIGLTVENYTDITGDSGISYSWSFHTAEVYSAYMSPDSRSNIGLPGNTIEYVFTIYNEGFLNDTYLLSVSGNSWQTEIYDSAGVPIDRISVPSGNSSDIYVRVTIPDTAAQNTADTATVNMQSENRSSVSDISTISTKTPFEAPWFDDTEGGSNGWTSNGLWELGHPTSGPSSGFSGNNCWATNLDGNYGNYANYELTSPYIHISSNETALYVEMWYSMESYYDSGNLQIKEMNSNTWTVLQPSEGPGYTSNYYAYGYTGSSGGWVQAGFELGSYVGSIVQIRFLFQSDVTITYPGWYVDNIFIGPPELPDIYDVRIDGSDYLSLEIGNVFNISATIDDTGGYNMNIIGAQALTNRTATKYSMLPADGSFDSPVESTYALVNTSHWNPGEYKIYVDGWDYIPMYNETHQTYVTLELHDTCPPVAYGETPSNASYTANSTPEISVNIRDFSDISDSSINLYINGFSVSFTKTAITDGYHISYQQENALSPGDEIVCRIVADDKYGNHMDWTWTFKINGPVEVSVHSGWNLITIPWLNSSTDVTSALSGISWDRAMTYMNGHWYTYNRNRDAKFNLEFPIVDNTVGIWVNCTADGTFNGTNPSPGTTDIPLYKGWNLVGFPSSGDATVSDSLSDIPWTRIETADASGSTYSLETGDYLRVGHAYWIYVSDDCTWSVKW